MSNFDENDVLGLGFDPGQLDVFNQNNSKGSGNPLIYKTSPSLAKNEKHVYTATIKVIYNPFAPKQSVLEQQSYSLEDKDGWLNVVSSLTVNDTNCPIFKAWKKCHYAKKDENPTLWRQAASEDEGGRALFDKRFNRYVLVQVLEDDNQPDKVGKFLFWKCPGSIWSMIDTKIHPTPESKKAAVPVMDYLFGRAIDITVTPGEGQVGSEKFNRDTKYVGEFSAKTVSCVNPDGSPLLNDSERAVLKAYVDAMEDVWNSKDPEERKRMEAEIKADPNTAELATIYKQVVEKMKQWCPNLLDELGYKPWSPQVAARVENWIKIVLEGNVPKEVNDAAENAGTDDDKKEDTKEEKPATTTTSAPAVESEPTDDLPF